MNSLGRSRVRTATKGGMLINVFRRLRASSTTQPPGELRLLPGDFLALAFLVLTWLLAVVLVNPSGDFPLNDDWAYATSVRALVEDGEFRLSHWTATNLLVQVLWGAIFCLPFGFSFTALRISTLVLGLAGILACYALLREARAGRKLALLGAWSLAANPIYFSLSFTFMSDVPFAAFAAGSSWLIVRGIRNNRLASTLLGLGLALAALLIRQVAFALLIAFGVAWLIQHSGSSRAKHLGIAALPCICGLAVQFGYQTWLTSSGNLPAKFGNQILTLLTQLRLPWHIVLWDAGAITAVFLAYLGLFLSPFLLAHRPIQGSPRQRLNQIAVAGGGLIIMAFLSARGKLMPLHGNVLSKGGIGPDVPAAPDAMWLAATFVALCGALTIAAALLRAPGALRRLVLAERGSPDAATLGFALAAIAIAFAPLPLLGRGPFGFYDRYLIIFIPWLLLMFVTLWRLRPGEVSTTAFRIGVLVLVSIAAFSTAATHDWLSVERSRWTALKELKHRCGINSQDIDGGFEFNGWVMADSPDPAGLLRKRHGVNP
jgi:hypothetical protein